MLKLIRRAAYVVLIVTILSGAARGGQACLASPEPPKPAPTPVISSTAGCDSTLERTPFWCRQ